MELPTSQQQAGQSQGDSEREDFGGPEQGKRGDGRNLWERLQKSMDSAEERTLDTQEATRFFYDMAAMRGNPIHEVLERVEENHTILAGAEGGGGNSEDTFLLQNTLQLTQEYLKDIGGYGHIITQVAESRTLEDAMGLIRKEARHVNPAPIIAHARRAQDMRKGDPGGKSTSNVRCYGCQEMGHYRSTCPYGVSDRANCDYCNEPGSKHYLISSQVKHHPILRTFQTLSYHKKFPNR